MKKYFFAVMLICLLGGCDEKKITPIYLIQHPKELEQQILDCQSNQNKSPDMLLHCKMVLETYSKVSSYTEMQRFDPENFGQQILSFEVMNAQLKMDCETAKQALADLKAKNPSADELKAAQDKFDFAEKAYQEAHEQLVIMLYVAGTNSPE